MILKRGKLPRTPHTEFVEDGNFTLEEIHGTYGFNGPYSRKNHLKNYPTSQCKEPKLADISMTPTPANVESLQPFMIHTLDIPVEGDFISSRKPILFGDNTTISISKPNQSSEKFFRNGEKHELYYVQGGEGVLKTEYGEVEIKKEHYISIPKGTTYNIEITKESYFMIFESKFPITFPTHYMNSAGQATLMSPVVETEIEGPSFKEPVNQSGEFEIYSKHDNGKLTVLTLGHHPFDIVGWEGTLYPFAFNIKNHHGIAREIHTAPPAHQTFQSGDGNTNGFSICSFVPQMEGWHQKDIPAPFAHLNVDSDEMVFFCNKKYGAREGLIKEGSITFHPASLPHSPHGDAALKSTKHRGKMNERLCVMLDTFFEELKVTDYAYEYSDKTYATSWYKGD